MMMKSWTEQQIFKEGDRCANRIRSYRQVKAHQEAVYRDTHREVNREVDQDRTEGAYRECNHEVARMVTEADFEQ
jgi:hypothetical protein